MIGLRAVRLALRAKLEELLVCSTGLAELTATTTGYQRASGSFLADGFAPGMEVTPVGFAHADVGVITAVTTGTLTIDGGRSVESAAPNRTLRVGLPSRRQWENVEFKKAAGCPYLVEQFVPGSTRQFTSGPGGILEGLHLFRPLVFVPDGVGAGAGDAYADALLTLFAPRTLINLDGGTLRVRTDAAPYRGRMLQSGPGFATVPVTVPLLLWTANAI